METLIKENKKLFFPFTLVKEVEGEWDEKKVSTCLSYHFRSLQVY